MKTIREQIAETEHEIELTESKIVELKDVIKNNKAKLKKLEKIEKELTNLFSEPKTDAA